LYLYICIFTHKYRHHSRTLCLGHICRSKSQIPNQKSCEREKLRAKLVIAHIQIHVNICTHTHTHTNTQIHRLILLHTPKNFVNVTKIGVCLNASLNQTQLGPITYCTHLANVPNMCSLLFYASLSIYNSVDILACYTLNMAYFAMSSTVQFYKYI